MLKDMSRNELEIRSFAEHDRDSVVALWKDVFSKDPFWNDPLEIIRSKMQVQPDLFLVGIYKNQLIATVMGGFDGFRGWVYHLAVTPNLRKRGFGKKIMETLEKKLLELGCPKINLQVRGLNRGIVEFYESLGYEEEDRISMGKRLK
jgi:ribosomal protein S18 acetylase RimI-like enzyme